MARKRISENQLNTRQLFSVQQILTSRGFEVIKEDDQDKLLITEANWEDEIWKKLFKVFNTTKWRIELKEYLYKKKAIQSAEVREIIEHHTFIKQYQRFDNTFEWFAGELIVQRFAAFSASFGIEVRNIMRNSKSTPAGDYDALVVLRDTNLAYFECKAGSFDDQAILKCYERMLSLNCEYSILFCVEKLDEAKLKEETAKIKIPVTGGHQFNKLFIKGNSQNIVYDLHNCYIIDMTGDIENKIRTVLRVNAAKVNHMHFGFLLEKETFDMLGYSVEMLDDKNYNDFKDASISF